MANWSNYPDIIAKWIQIPMAILTILAAGTVLNLQDHLDELTKPVSDGSKNSLIKFITTYSVQFGFYSGIIPGFLIDGFGHFASFYAAAIISGISYTTIGLLGTSTWNEGIGILIIVYLAVTGFAAAIAVLNTISTVI